MNRTNLDSRTLGIFDTIGSYFIDQFYNAHYIMAKELVSQGRVQSITDAYRANVINYMRGISRNDLYLTVVKKLHQFYQKATDYGAVLFHDFENKVLEQFIPQEYYKHFDERQKDTTLKAIITKCVQDLGEFIISPNILKRVIDDHMNKNNIAILQDKAIDNFTIQRENYYADFAAKINESKQTVNKKVLDKLKEEYVHEKRRSCNLEDDKLRAIDIIRQLTEKLTKYEMEIASLKKQLPESQTPQPTQKPTVRSSTVTARPDDIRKPTNNTVKNIKDGRVENSPPPKDDSDSESDDDENQQQKQREEMLRRLNAIKSEKTNKNIKNIKNDEDDPDNSTGNSDLLDDDPWLKEDEKKDL